MYRDGHPFLITIGTHDRIPWFSRYPELAARFVSIIQDAAQQRGTQLFAWCLMPDHLHSLMIDADVIEYVRLIKGRATPVARRLDRSRRLWQRSFHDHALRKAESLETVSSYIWENPLRAGIVGAPEDYPWSGSNVWPDWRSLYKGGRA